MRCLAPMLFTCIAVQSPLVVKGGCMCETYNVGANNKMLGGPGQTRKIQYRRELAQFNPRTRLEWTYSQGAARDNRSSMYKMYNIFNRYNVASHMIRKRLGSCELPV